MNQGLTKYLKDFSQFVPVEEPATLSHDTDISSSAFDHDWAMEADPVIDVEEEKRKAFAEGQEAARLQATEAHEAELQALRAAQADELERLKTRYEEEIAGHLATSVISMKQMISGHIEDVCLRLFATLAEREFAEKAAADLAQQIIREIDAGFAGTIKISGPDALISTMREKLAGSDHHIDYDVNNDIDVQVHMDSSVLMTRLADFFQSVRGLAGE